MDLSNNKGGRDAVDQNRSCFGFIIDKDNLMCSPPDADDCDCG